VILFVFLFVLVMSSFGILASIIAYYYDLCAFGNVSRLIRYKQTCILRAAVNTCPSLAVQSFAIYLFVMSLLLWATKYTYIYRPICCHTLMDLAIALLFRPLAYMF